MRFFMTLAALAVAATADAQASRFYAVINHLGAFTAEGTTSTETGITGFATFTLEESGPGSPTLAYDLRFSGADFLGDANPGNDVTAIHFHDTAGLDQSAATPHVLNVFGFPSQDDGQMVVEAVAGRVTGVWDDGDLTDPLHPMASNPMANSDTLTSMLGALQAGEIYVMLHTTSPNALPNSGGITIGGAILPVPEPTSATLGLLVLAGVATKRFARQR